MKKSTKRSVVLVCCLLLGVFWFIQNSSMTSIYAYDGREVILDAGHGGYDPGALANGMLEKDITLEITQMVKKELESQGIKVTMTRNEDHALGEDEMADLEERVHIANHTNARYFVSIHTNASQTHASNGMEIYHNRKGKILAQQVHEELNTLQYTQDRGTIQDRRLYVLKHTNMAAILIEVAFIDGNSDRIILNNKRWKQKIAKQISKGIRQQMDVDEQGDKEE